MKIQPCLLSSSLLALALAACSPAPQPAENVAPAPAPEPAAGTDVAATQSEGLAIQDPWIRQPPPATQVAGGYLRIDNPGPEPDRLVAVETDAAERVEIHEMEEVDGMMRMRELVGGLEVPATGHVALEPGGYHLMLMGAREGLEAGQQVDGVLVFERAGRVETTFDVRPPGAGAGGHGGDDGHAQGH